MPETTTAFKDHYATLGVPRTAPYDEIRLAYRKLARQYHPDVNQEPEARRHFMAAAEAHEALIDADRRRAYDEALDQHERRHQQRSYRSDAHVETAANATMREEAFKALLRRTDRTRRREPITSHDLHASLEITLEDAYHGARRTVSLPRTVVDAQGRVSVQNQRLEVDVPKGVRPGQRLRLAGQGSRGQDGAPAGDLYLDITMQPHPLFRVEGRDVLLDLPAVPWEATLGATVTAPTPEGPVQLTIPPGSTPGRRLRLEGRGLPGRPPGHLYVVLSIVLPPADTEAARLAYQAMAQAFQDYPPPRPAPPA